MIHMEPSETNRRAGTQDASLEEFDVVVLGSGEGGKYLAWTLAKQGQAVALVEKQYIGGSCPNIACLPSKNIIHSAKVASYFDRSEEFGITKGSYTIHMSTVRDRKRTMVDGLVEIHRKNFESTGTELILGFGTFVGHKMIAVALNAGGQRLIRGKNIVISTGSKATIEAIPGLAETNPLTHVEALELDEVPRHLIVLGAGFVGLELAQAMRRFGSEVTVIDRNERVLHQEDEDVSEGLHQLFEDEGIHVIEGAHIICAHGRSGESVSLRYVKNTFECIAEGSHLLVSTGRTPNTAGIGLEQTGVEVLDSGYIKVNERLETTADGVWAMGECAGSPQFTHIAYDDFRIVRENIAGRSRSTAGRQVPRCLYTDPEFARVGLTETEAKAKSIPYRSVKIPMASVLRSRTVSETRGFLKAILDVNSDRILGFAAFGADAGEVMGTVQMAMIAELPYTVVRDAILTHPTMVEGLVTLFSAVPLGS